MKDLHSQLADMFGAKPAAAEEAPSESSGNVDPLLESDAHHGSDWWNRVLAIDVDGAPKRNALAPLHAALQQTDGTLKALKKAGRKAEARAISEERAQWLGKREKAAWAAVKQALGTLGTSDKLYRSLKQGGTDPVTVLRRIDEHDESELRGASVKRLKAMLGG